MKSAMPSMTRRRFLAAGAAALAGPMIVPASALGLGGRPAPSERIVMGVIGVGGQGDRDMRSLMGLPAVQMVAVCDVDSGSENYERGWYRGRSQAVNAIKEYYAKETASGVYRGVVEYVDFMELLARDDIDAVSIATPDHWHAIMAVEAAKAGKDIYCQKPLSLTIREGRAMADAVHRYGRVFQTGSQRRSSAKCRHSCELVRNGRIGKLHTIKVGLPGGQTLVEPGNPISEPPPNLDYDRWLGPAPWAPYTTRRCHFTFRWNYDYSGGQVTDWGAHMIDMAHWGMDTELSGPVEVEGEAVYPSDWLNNTATDFEFRCTYAQGYTMIVSSKFPTGVRFEGSDGWLDLEGGAEPASLKHEPIGPNEVRLYKSDDHYRNFVDAIRTRSRTAAPVEIAHRSISVSHLANIAMKLRRKIRWDPATERILDDPVAERMLSRPMRSPWCV
ncbi:MAG: Gfo/Idh/MocA family oxidoreductase [Candidatus Hydrogenedentes bacterium]|nr:Gfo/Idh/MocA family oxidoreductase [Candidatus Hydrogenedentota bacterium]